MKRRMLKLSVLAVFALAGGAMTSLQAGTPNGEVYDVNFSLNNSTPICEVYGLPSVNLSDGSVDVLDYDVTVDGAGKITGFAHVQLTSGDATSTVMTTVTGKMGMKGKDPVVNMTIKGPGYSTSGGTDGKANLSLKFSGTPSPLSVGITPSASYTGYEMAGKVNGTFNPGIKGTSNVKVKNAAGTISDMSGTTQIDSCILTLVVVNNKLTLGGCLTSGNGDLYYHNEFNGKGSANLNNGKFNFTLTGTGPATGSNVKVKGNSVTINPQGDVSLTSMTASGKMMGQKVDAAGEGNLTVQSPAL